MAADAAAEALIGTALRDGDYVLKSVIASGGQATVYRAFARPLETDVAVKVLHPRYANDLSFRERFHDEARRLAQLHHPNLLEVHWYGEEGALIYIVMRLVPGGTLLQRLQALGGALPMTETGRLIAQIASALQHAHDRNVLHLDIKPANILLGQADWPLVADLGLTRAIAKQQGHSQDQRVAGTPAYMSPEQCRGDDLDGRSDQYSLAVTAYEILTGQRPFQAATTDGLMHLQQHSPPPRPSSIAPGLPGPVEDVLLRGLAKDPEDRYPSIGQFGNALSEAIERTRGVSLETKRAAAGAAPSVLAVLALVLAAPLLIAMLPVGSVLGRLPFAWPFQLLLSGAVVGLLFGIRWHVIGLVGRAVGGLPSPAWRRTARASVEGVVNLVYLLVAYRLIGTPLLGILWTLLSPEVVSIVDTGLALVVGAGALVILVRMFRSAGPVPTLLVLTLCWCVAVFTPTGQFGFVSLANVGWTVQLFVALALLALLLMQRASLGAVAARVSAERLGRLLVEASPGITAEQASARRQQCARLAVAVLDFAYLLLGYALVRGPLLGLLSPLTSELAAAILTSASAAVVWIILVARLHWIAGFVGLALGLVIGSPILLSLPLLDPALLQASWPTTIAAWLAGGVLLVLIAALRTPSQSLAQNAFGAQLDRGLLGTSAAATEDQSGRRSRALGRVAGALLDVLLLLVIYWVVGVPLTNGLVETTHQPVLATLVLGAVLLLGLLWVFLAARRAASTLEETGGTAWRRRAPALVALATAFGAAIIAFGAAAPAALAGPTALSDAALGPTLSRAGDVVIVDWDSWLPWSPRMEEATHLLALSCSNGQPIGEFREAFAPAAGAAMPSGAAGPAATTRVPCDQWQQVYSQRRHAAGLPDQPSYSWDWVDFQATLNPDRSVSVTQTTRVFFSSGRFSTLAWELGSSATGSVEDLQVASGAIDAASGALYTPSTPPLSSQLTDSPGGRVVNWSFPEVSGPALRTFVLRYRLRDSAAADPSTVFQQLIASADHAQPIWNSTVEVHLPSDLSGGALELRSDSAGVRSGMLDQRTAVFAAQNLGSGSGFSVEVALAPGSSLAPAFAAPLPDAPSALATATPTGTPTSTQAAAAASATSTSTPTLPAATATPTSQPRTATASPSSTPESPTATPEAPTVSPTSTPEAPTATPSATPEAPTVTPTSTPEAPTATATEPPTFTPTPTELPAATSTPTPEPTLTPTPTSSALQLPSVPGSAATRFGIAEGFSAPSTMADTQADWERIIVSWADVQPQNPGDFSRLGQTISNAQVQGELARGVKLTGVLQFTPGWAQVNPDQGQRSAPRNLDLPYDDPNNYWGQFVYQSVKFYAGRIDEWVIWNEPEFKPGDAGGGQSFTWQGTDAEFAQLLKVAYLAAKKANPNAIVSFPGTSYWIDQNSGRPQFYDRVLRALAGDRDAPRAGFYHDRVALNLYRAADDVMRVFQIYKAIQARYGLDKPIWLTESNSMPTDDQALGACSHASDAIKTSMQEQAAYAIQAFAMAAASGYERVGFYRMTDGNPCTEPAVWGVVRDDGSKRPVEDALRTAITNFLGFNSAQFVPLIRLTQNWSAWPEDPNSYTPNWQVYQVAFDKPGGQRVTVLWNGDGAQPSTDASASRGSPQPPGGHMVQIAAHGSHARAIDKFGEPYPYFNTADGHLVVYLKPATASFEADPAGYHFIGGDPVLILEDGVDGQAPVDVPELLSGSGDAAGPTTPASTGGAPDLALAVNPAGGLTIVRGEAADFAIATQGLNGLKSPISLRIVEWSTQRFPQPKPTDTLPFAVSLPDSVPPGRTATLHIETSDANDVGIYYLTVAAEADGVTHTVDVALAVDPPQ